MLTNQNNESFRTQGPAGLCARGEAVRTRAGWERTRGGHGAGTGVTLDPGESAPSGFGPRALLS